MPSGGTIGDVARDPQPRASNTRVATPSRSLVQGPLSRLAQSSDQRCAKGLRGPDRSHDQELQQPPDETEHLSQRGRVPVVGVENELDAQDHDPDPHADGKASEGGLRKAVKERRDDEDQEGDDRGSRAGLVGSPSESRAMACGVGRLRWRCALGWARSPLAEAPDRP